MENPNNVNLKNDDYWRLLGWPAVARDKDGHAITMCVRSCENDGTFKDWLLECFDAGLIVTKLSGDYHFDGAQS